MRRPSPAASAAGTRKHTSDDPDEHVSGPSCCLPVLTEHVIMAVPPAPCPAVDTTRPSRPAGPPPGASGRPGPPSRRVDLDHRPGGGLAHDDLQQRRPAFIRQDVRDRGFAPATRSSSGATTTATPDPIVRRRGTPGRPREAVIRMASAVRIAPSLPAREHAHAQMVGAPHQHFAAAPHGLRPSGAAKERWCGVPTIPDYPKEHQRVGHD